MIVNVYKTTGSMELAFDGHPPQRFTEVEKRAWLIVSGELEGRVWDYDNHKWEPPPGSN